MRFSRGVSASARVRDLESQSHPRAASNLSLRIKRDLDRRIVLTVPTSRIVLAHLSSSDLIAVLPRRLVERQACRFALAFVELPLKRKPDPIQAVATKAAMMDAGIAWLMGLIVESVASSRRSEPST
jgi:DNA-binding transcriptional LysR family regulator